MKVEIYSDIACPWCYIGEARFERALRALPNPDEVRNEIAGVQRLRIGAVRTFVFDGPYTVQGAQPTATFLQPLETVAKESPTRTGENGDTNCADGACAL